MAPPKFRTTKKPTVRPVTNRRIDYVNKRANQGGFKTSGPQSEAVRKMYQNAKSTYSLNEHGRSAYKKELNRDFSSVEMQNWLKDLYDRGSGLVTRTFPAGNPKDDQGPSTSKKAKLAVDSTDISDASTPDNTNSNSQHSNYSNAARDLAKVHEPSNLGSDFTQSSSGSSQSSRRTNYRPIQNLVNDSGLGNDIEMGLPGTGQGTGGSGDGNANDGMEVYHPERPLTIFGKKQSTYRKVHRFLSFAIAPTFLTETKTDPTENQVFITTALASIPWEQPVLYMNPSEFDLLPDGSYCKEVRVKIVHRGNRIAFETGEVATRLATLNQIQNVMVAFGLNKTGWGTNFSYDTFDASNPMKPTSLLAPIETNYDENFYGKANADAQFTSYIPLHQIGIPYPLPNYFNICNAVENFGGTPPLTENVNFFDGKTTINECIGEFTYTPKFGQLKMPLKHIRSGLPRIDETSYTRIPVNGCLSTTNTVTMQQSTNDATGGTVQILGAATAIDNSASALGGLFTINDYIEKSQSLKQGPWGQYEGAQIQPSIHVGLQAIPSLTSTGILSPIANWTDGQADWDVICEMDVIEYNPTKLPYATAANVPAGDVIYRADGQFIPNTNNCTYAGLHMYQPIR